MEGFLNFFQGTTTSLGHARPEDCYCEQRETSKEEVRAKR